MPARSSSRISCSGASLPRRRRGWPVVGRGTPEGNDQPGHMRWRRALNLPEESPDFSDRDVFDLVDHLLGHSPAEPAVAEKIPLYPDTPMEESA